MKIRKVGKIGGGQDGAIYKNELFRFDTRGRCSVYDLSAMPKDASDAIPTATFTLDRAKDIVPHSNAVCFGTERFCEGDEYPLLYSNIYNNYASGEDKRIGVCCVYRLERSEDGYKSTLVQLIKIGFCEDSTRWRMSEGAHGTRPYGNFLVDIDTGSYYAFVMRSEEQGTAYFKFDIPSVHSGDIDPALGIRCAVLGVSDIKEEFTCPYHRYVQGATVHGGYLYSTEGFANDTVNRPAIRIISLSSKAQVAYMDLTELGYYAEPEMIDFYNGDCYYSDAHGNFYTVDFEI